MREISPDLIQVTEPNHVTFYIQRRGDYALLVDSGLGLVPDEFKNLLAGLGIRKFDVINTHLHCDHAGMNYLAEKVYVHRKEWEKYTKLSDQRQIHHYYALLKLFKNWPAEVTHDTKDFSDRITFIEEGDLSIEGFQLKAVFTPGHTSGHMLFSSDEFKVLFTGDLIYDGMLFANLPDSHFADYVSSMRELVRLEKSTGHAILPSHNSIPLPEHYPEKVLRFFEDIAAGKIQGTAVKENSIFKEAIQYTGDNVKAQVTGRTK